ncbi:MAG: hypothetical protein HWN66_14340 [Candidatus Helarchaeota archaeon]|nr:hypothetical protein [Candidatus Helarchaeota archaeon]
MALLYSIIGSSGFIILISLVILHIFHFRGPYLLPFQKVFRYFTRYEHYVLRFMFILLNTDILYKNRLIRFIPEFISYFFANGAYPSIYTLQELIQIINIIYKKNGGSGNSATKFGILLRPCPCRDAQRNYSKTLPNVTDVLLTNNVQALSKGRDNVFISKNQLIKKLRKFDEIGLIHVVLGCCGEEGHGINICNCHKSACFPLKAILARGFRRGLAPGPSIATCDLEKCKGIDDCGKCLTRCPFHARIVKDRKGEVIADSCYGCGLCANTCESGATQMIPRAGYKNSYFPLQWIRSY